MAAESPAIALWVDFLLACASALILAGAAARLRRIWRAFALVGAGFAGLEAAAAMVLAASPPETKSLDMADDDANRHPWHVVGIDEHVIAREALDPTRFAAQTSSRVVVLGDSFAAGNGVGRALAFPSLIEGWDVVNLAVPGAGIWDEIAIYEHWGRWFDPDVVVLAVVLNDLGNSRAISLGDGDAVLDLFEVSDDHWTWPYFLNLVGRSVAVARATEELEDAYIGAWSDERSLAGFRERLAHLAALAGASDTQVLVVILPMLHDLSNYPFTEAHLTITREARALGLETLDLLDEFVDADESEFWAASSDHHPNAEAHRRIGAALAERLAALETRNRAASPALPHADSVETALSEIEAGVKTSRGCGGVEPSTALLMEAYVAVHDELSWPLAAGRMADRLRRRIAACGTSPAAPARRVH